MLFVELDAAFPPSPDVAGSTGTCLAGTGAKLTALCWASAPSEASS